MSRRHFIIPDRQNKPGVPLEHNLWIGAAIAKYEPDVVIDLGDGADFESINSHADPGALSREGKRLKADFDAYNEGEQLLREGMGDFKPRRKIRLRGNHEHRLTRFIEKNPVLEGLISLDMLDDKGWEVIPYDNGQPGIVEVDGVAYAHYFSLPNNGNSVTGTIATRIARIGGSFVQGHMQGLMRGDVQYATGRRAYGIVAGSSYIHDEGYKGAANKHWRGALVLNEVRNGQFDDLPLSLDYLCKLSEGTSLARYMQRRYRNAKARFSVARVAA
jgi:hypothetical protein